MEIKFSFSKKSSGNDYWNFIKPSLETTIKKMAKKGKSNRKFVPRSSPSSQKYGVVVELRELLLRFRYCSLLTFAETVYKITKLLGIINELES